MPFNSFPGDTSVKEPACHFRFDLWVGKIPWRRAWEPTPIFLPGESHGQGSLAGYRPLSLKELDMTEATFHACHTDINKTKAGLQIYIESFCIPIKIKIGQRDCFIVDTFKPQ